MAFLPIRRSNSSGQYPMFAALGGSNGGAGQFLAPSRTLVNQSPQQPGRQPIGRPYGMGPGQSPNPPAAPQAQARSNSPLFDPTTDPVLQQIHALGTRKVADAVSGGDELRKQLLIAYGDPSLARSTQFGDLNSGITGDETTALAADQNPFSTLKTLLQGHQGNQAAIDNASNASNTYYGSVHANQLGQENSDYLRNLADAQSAVRGHLSDIAAQLLQAHQSADQANAQALQQATQDAINTAVQNGYTFGGYDASGNPILYPPAGGGGGGGAPSDGGGGLPSPMPSTAPAPSTTTSLIQQLLASGSGTSRRRLPVDY